jgi:hypothetical protein
MCYVTERTHTLLQKFHMRVKRNLCVKAWFVIHWFHTRMKLYTRSELRLNTTFTRSFTWTPRNVKACGDSQFFVGECKGVKRNV